MKMSFAEQMRVAMRRRGVSVQDLADRLGTSRQNVNQRLNSGKFTEKDMEKYSTAIGCSVIIDLVDPDQDGGGTE